MEYINVGATYEDVVALAIESYKSSTQNLWECARHVHRLYAEYGLYEREFTAILVNELAVQRDTVYHWRKAWELRTLISESFPNFDHARLSISHYYRAADHLDMGIEWVTEFLELAAEESWSTRRLAMELEQATDDSGTLPWLKRKLANLLKGLTSLYQSAEYSGLSDEDQNTMAKAIAMLERLAE